MRTAAASWTSTTATETTTAETGRTSQTAVSSPDTLTTLPTSEKIKHQLKEKKPSFTDQLLGLACQSASDQDKT